MGKEPKKHLVRMEKNGIVYVYESESYWDSEKKQPRSRRKLIGHEDPETGMVVPNRGYSKGPTFARTFVSGPHLLFDAVAERIGLKKTLRDTLPEDADGILTCAYYMLSEGKALSRCEQWSAGAVAPLMKRFGDQRISEMLDRLKKDSQMRFFSRWVSEAAEDDTYALDITSISSYSDEIGIVRAGYNRDHENLEQINLALLIGSETYRPLFYSILPGNINDRSSLKRFVGVVNSIGLTKFRIVMDKGFCTKANIDMLYEEQMKFTISLVGNLKFAQDAIAEAKSDIVQFSNYRQILNSKVFLVTSLKDWNGHRCYTHVYYDETKKDKDIARFMDRLLRCRGILEEGGTPPERDRRFCERFFTIRETPKRGRKAIPNEGEIASFRERDAGFLVLISNCEKDPAKCLEVYRAKETAESGFDDLKNDEDLYRMRVHTEYRMDGKMFIAFVALAIKMELNRMIYSDGDLKSRSVQEVIDEMKLLRSTFIEGRRKPFHTELTKLQKIVMKTFGIGGEFDIDLPESADDDEIRTYNEP